MHLIFTIISWYIFLLSVGLLFMQASRYVGRRDKGTATDEQYWWIYATIAVIVLSGTVAIKLTWFWG